MRKIRPVPGRNVPLILLSLFLSCRTVDVLPDNPVFPDLPDYTPLLPEEKEPEERAELPHPALALSLFLPLPVERGDTPSEEELPLPEFHDQSDALSSKEDGDGGHPEEPTASTPEVTRERENAVLSVPPVVKANDEPAGNPPAETAGPSPSIQDKKGAGDSVPDEERDIPTIKEETFSAGEAGLMALDGSDWFFMKERDGSDVEYVDRTTMDGRTLFSFQFPGPGVYYLIFQRQDHSTGDTEKGEILVTIEEAGNAEEMIRDGFDAAPALSNSIIEEPTSTPVADNPSVEQAAERLEVIEDDPEKVEETLQLLEFLVDAASDDESLAEYYYRMARTLEKNTRFQDLKRAYDTYEYIEKTFFLTDYYEKSVERIRYLDRHFFKLR